VTGFRAHIKANNTSVKKIFISSLFKQT